MENTPTVPNDTPSPWRPWVLALYALAAFTWAAPLRDLYGLEARSGLIVREMLRGGMTFVPQVMGRPYPDYLPLYFWVAALFCKAFTQFSTVAMVLPSAISASLLVALTSVVGGTLSPALGITAPLILATLPDFWFMAGSATVDMLLALFVTVSVACLWKRHQGAEGRKGKLLRVGAYGAVVGAFFTKGLVGPVLVAGVWGGYLLWEAQWRKLVSFSLSILALALLCSAAQFVLVWQQGGRALLHQVLEAQFFSRIGDQPNEPIYYYARCILVGATGPWLLWLMALAMKQWRTRTPNGSVADSRPPLLRLPVVRLAVVWFIGVLAIFSLASTRHGRYLLPLFPPMALLLALVAEKLDRLSGHQTSGSFDRFFFWFFAGTMGVSWGGYFVFHRSGRVGIYWLILWSLVSVIVWGWIRHSPPRISRQILYPAFVLAFLLSGATLLVHPVISARESGRDFIQEAEAGIPARAPVVLFRMAPDGDGVKVALYSSRRSSHLVFPFNGKAVARLKGPFLVITLKKDEDELLDALSMRKFTLLRRGYIHHQPAVAYFVQGRKIEGGI